MQKLIFSFLSFVSLVFCARINAQTREASDLEQLRRLFQQQLKRSQASVPPVDDINGEKPGIHILIIKNNNPLYQKLSSESPDAFHVKASSSSLTISGVTISALQNGVFWYLHHIGYRYYFPNEKWHYIPKLQTVFKSVDKVVSPSFSYRRIWYAYGSGSKIADKDYDFWSVSNLQGGIEINAGHAYEGIVNRNKTEFLQHPEYFAQNVNKGSIPGNAKFEVSNEALVQLCINDAMKQIERILEKQGKAPTSISMDPSDGGGFSIRPESLKIGGPSEQVFYLANRVAKAIRQKYPTVKVGLYAYNFHAEPPKQKLESNIVVLLATSMNRTKYRTEELIDLWHKKGVNIGIRDYFGVMAWDWDMPGQPRGGRLSYVEKLKGYYKSGIRLFSAETNIGWMSRGLGHYIAARMLWDVNTDALAVANEFMDRMYGKAAPFMKQIHQHWQEYRQSPPLDGDIYDWSQLVEKAATAEESPAVRQRLNHMKQYLHYVVLYKNWRKDTSDKNLIALLNYAYRIQDEGIMASYPLFRRIANSAVKHKPNMRFNDRDVIWKQNNLPVTETETSRNFLTDLQTLDKNQKTVKPVYPATFKNDGFGRTDNFDSGGHAKPTPSIKLRGGHKFIFQIGNQTDAALNISVGLIKSKNFKSLILKVYPYDVGLQTESGQLVFETKLEPGLGIQKVPLKTLRPGLYLALIDDAKSGFQISFNGSVRWGIVADGQQPTLTFGRNKLVFNVEKNVQQFYVVNKGVVTLVSPSGRVIDLQQKPGRIAIRVENSEFGIWRMMRQSGTISLEGILPLLSSDAARLLVQ